jgi:hypothetical protein
MGRGIIQTHAGDDSDGKIWGIEGMNILFILVGLLVSLGLTLMLSRHHALPVTLGLGAVPFAAITTYVFTLRQGKPKAYDSDLLSTLLDGNGWTPPARQPRNPLSSHAGT